MSAARPTADRGKINGISVEGVLIAVRPAFGLASYTGTLRLAARDVPQLERMMGEFADLVYDGPAHDGPVPTTIRVPVTIAFLPPDSTRISVQSSGPPITRG